MKLSYIILSYINSLGVFPCAICEKMIRAPVRSKGQGIHPNDDHPDIVRVEGQNRQRQPRLFEIWFLKTLLKYTPRGATGKV